jgi:hypothetical protein
MQFFIECGPKFKSNHSFMSRHGAGKQNEIQAQFEDFLEETTILDDHYLVDPTPFSNWQLDVVNWYNNWIKTGWIPKPPQLYLYGESNVGKSRIIKFIFSNLIFFKY